MRSINNQKGSALLLVLMVSLVLSAFGLVAMRDIAIGVHQSASFRVRTQASSVSEAAASAFSMRAGNQSSAYVHALKSTTKRGSVFGGNDPSKYKYTASENQFQETLASHGGFIVFRHSDLSTGTSPFVVNHPVGSGAQKGETGLFRGPSTLTDVSSFEAQNETEFLVVLRDLKDGIPAPGFSDRYCFKKATVAAQARVGERPATFDTPATFAIGTHTNDILIGPIECGYN